MRQRELMQTERPAVVYDNPRGTGDDSAAATATGGSAESVPSAPANPLREP